MTNLWKGSWILFLAAALVLGLSACSDDDDNGGGGGDFRPPGGGGDGGEQTAGGGEQTGPVISLPGGGDTTIPGGGASVPSLPGNGGGDDGCPAQCADACADVGHDNFEFFSDGQVQGCGINQIGVACGGQPVNNQVTVYPCLADNSGCMRDLSAQGGFICVANMGSCNDGDSGCLSGTAAIESCEAGFAIGTNCASFQSTCDAEQGACLASAQIGCLPPILVCPAGQTCEGANPQAGQPGQCQ